MTTRPDKKWLKHGMACAGLACLLLTGHAGAQQRGPRFESDDFLRDFDSFVDQRRTLDPAEPEAGHSTFSLTLDEDKPSGGLRLFDPLEGQSRTIVEGRLEQGDGVGAPPVAGLGQVATPGGTLRGVGSETSSAEIGLSYNPRSPNGLFGQALRIGLRSQVTRARSELFGGPLGPYFAQSQNNPDYFVGLDFSYWRVQLDASLSRSSALGAEGYEGFGLGIGYDFGGLITRIGIGDYRLDEASAIGGSFLTGANGSRLTEYELGAAWRLSEDWEINGGLRIFDYSASRYLFDASPSGESIFIGTRLGF